MFLINGGSFMPPHLQKILADLQKRLRMIYGDKLVKMVLYGSQARGDAAAGSDVDVLVVLRDEKVVQSEEIARTLPDVADISINHDMVISCLFLDEKRYANEQSPLLLNIRQEGATI